MDLTRFISFLSSPWHLIKKKAKETNQTNNLNLTLMFFQNSVLPCESTGPMRGTWAAYVA